MDDTTRRKELLAVDGSDQALEAVRYAGIMLPGDCTEIVLFNVGTGFPEVFWDMDRNPLYESKQPRVMEWLAQYQLGIGEFNEKALHILMEAGFDTDAVRVKTQARKIGIFKDILQESYHGYSAVIVARSGMSRLKDLFIGSLAYKLADNIKHIPTIIVAGKPSGKKILIALDESIESMRGVSCIGALTAQIDPEIYLYHRIQPATKTEEAHQDWQKYQENRFKPFMDEASLRLADMGVGHEKILRHFICVKGNATQDIIETAQTNGFSTIVTGRRDSVSLTREYIRGRFSQQIIKSLNNMAVWVVN